MSQVSVAKATIESVVEITKSIPEFSPSYAKSYFEDRYLGHRHLIIVGSAGGHQAGYIVGYDRDQDGSFYLWMAGVNPSYRRLGVLTSLMGYAENWARENGYKQLKIKTRNNRRAMLAYLVKQGYLFTDVEPHDDLLENRVELIKPL